MFRESRQYIAFLLLVLIPCVSAGTARPLPSMYFAILGVVLFIILVAIAARIADRYHLWESFKSYSKRGENYAEDDGRFEMKEFKGFGFGDHEEGATPVLYEKRKHEKRGLTYEDLANEVDAKQEADQYSIQAPVEPQKPSKKDRKEEKKERKEERERQLREELSRSMGTPFNTNYEPASKSETVEVLSPRQPRAIMSPKDRRAMSPPPPPPKPRTDMPTSPSHKRAMSPTPRGSENPVSFAPKPRTKTPLSPTPRVKDPLSPTPRVKNPLSPQAPRVKNPLSPQAPRRTPLSPRGLHNTLPANSSSHAGLSEPVTTPTGYHYGTLPPGGYYAPHPGGYPPVPPSPGYPVYPYPHPGVPAYPGYPPRPLSIAESEDLANSQPLPIQPGAYHMPYPYPHPGYYPPHPGYPHPPTTPEVSQSKHQSQL